MDQLTLIGAVHFFAFISIGALPRGSASRLLQMRGSDRAAGNTAIVMPESPDGGGGADASDEEVIVCLSQCPEGLPRGSASIEIKAKSTLPRIKLARPLFSKMRKNYYHQLRPFHKVLAIERLP